MDAVQPREELVAGGWIRVWLEPCLGLWLVTWMPHDGDPDYPGRTLIPGADLMPDDLPTSNDPEDLMRWARARWSGAQSIV